MDAPRRRFLRQGLGFSGLMLWGWHALPALAQQKSMLDPGAYQARALGYVEHADDAADTSAYQPGRRCGNCAFFAAQTQDCDLFPAHRVSADGWCSAWSKTGS